MDRFFRQLGFNPGHELTLYCDNAQTVDLLNKARPLLATKLRHVDIHQHWLRQGVQIRPMDSCGFNACRRFNEAPTKRQAPRVCTFNRDEG